MPAEPTVRSLAKELGATIEQRLQAAGGEHRAPPEQPPWPDWSPELFTVWLGMPKTAGTSLWEILRKFENVSFETMRRGDETDSALGIQRISIIGELWSELAPEKRGFYKFAGGHLPYAAGTASSAVPR